MQARTTAQWWDGVVSDEAKLIDWLKKQYHGERTAAGRIHSLVEKIPLEGEKEARKYDWRRRILLGIISDEIRHSIWVSHLLTARGITPEILKKGERYWDAVLPSTENKSFEYLCAVGHLAEEMRLERIKVIANYKGGKEFDDIVGTFNAILPDEEFHTKLFGILSTPEAIGEARKFHGLGMNALGLVP